MRERYAHRWMALTRMGTRRIDAAAVLVTGCLELAVYLGIHVAKWPHFEGWWVGLDQQRYLTAARAWSFGNFDPGAHYYLPGYSLVAAAFVRIFPAQPFVVVDLACIVLMLGLFVAICRRLAPEMPNTVPVACVAFLMASLSSRAALAVWVVPWTTTPAAPATLWALLSALRFADAPAARPAFVAAFAGALIAWFRPADSAVVLCCIGTFFAWVALNRPCTILAVAGYAAGTLFGVTLAVAPLIAVHYWIFGPALGPYLALSAGEGFEWRLIAIRWVTIALDPRPLFDAGPGLIAVFPWIIPGIAGLLFCVLGRRREAHALVGGTLVLTWVLYLSYRNLQVPNLWRFYNYHYFKWTQPFLAFYTLVWLRGMFIRPYRLTAALSGVAVVLLLLPWRAGVDVLSTAPAIITHQPDGMAALELPGGLSDIDDVALMSINPGWQDQTGGAFELDIDGHRFSNEMVLGVYSYPSAIMLLPLRTLPPGPATVVLDHRVEPGPDASLTVGRQRIRFGPPCLFSWMATACHLYTPPVGF